MELDLLPGAQIRVINGEYARMTGVVDSHIFGPSHDHQDEGPAFGYGVVLDDGQWILVRHDQVRIRFRKSADRGEA